GLLSKYPCIMLPSPVAGTPVTLQLLVDPATLNVAAVATPVLFTRLAKVPLPWMLFQLLTGTTPATLLEGSGAPLSGLGPDWEIGLTLMTVWAAAVAARRAAANSARRVRESMTPLSQDDEVLRAAGECTKPGCECSAKNMAGQEKSD